MKSEGGSQEACCRKGRREVCWEGEVRWEEKEARHWRVICSSTACVSCVLTVLARAMLLEPSLRGSVRDDCALTFTPSEACEVLRFWDVGRCR